MRIFRFGRYEADEQKFELREAGRLVPIQRIVLETLFVLLRNRARVISKRDIALATRVGLRVTDAAVSRTIMLARRAISDSAGAIIVTVHGVGHRFVCDVEELELGTLANGSWAATSTAPGCAELGH